MFTLDESKSFFQQMCVVIMDLLAVVFISLFLIIVMLFSTQFVISLLLRNFGFV